MLSRVDPSALVLEPEGPPSLREPAFGTVLLLLFALFALHRLIERVAPGLLGGRPSGTTAPAGPGGGQCSALSRVRGVSGPVGIGGRGGEGFLRALLVELITRGGGVAVLGLPELRRLLGEEVEPRLLALLELRLVVCDGPEEAVAHLGRRLSEGSAEGAHLYWFLAPEHAPRPLPEHERLHVLLIGPWPVAWEISPDGLLDGETVPTLTVLEAAERLHLFSLTL